MISLSGLSFHGLVILLPYVASLGARGNSPRTMSALWARDSERAALALASAAAHAAASAAADDAADDAADAADDDAADDADDDAHTATHAAALAAVATSSSSSVAPPSLHATQVWITDRHTASVYSSASAAAGSAHRAAARTSRRRSAPRLASSHSIQSPRWQLRQASSSVG